MFNKIKTQTNQYKLYIISLFLMVLSYNLYSQTTFISTYTYTHDDAGNRISRIWTLISGKVDTIHNRDTVNYGTTDTADTAEPKPLQSELFGEQKLSVYPNPNNGVFSIAISPMPADAEPYYELVNSSGKRVILQQKISEDIQDIDISHQPNGVYFLNVKINKDKSTVIKVIKNI